MKKIVLVFLLVTFVCAVSFGLDVSVGAKGAAGFSGFAGQDYADLLESFGGKRAFFLGFGGGVFATVGLLDLLAELTQEFSGQIVTGYRNNRGPGNQLAFF